MTTFDQATELAHQALLAHEQQMGGQDDDQLFYASYLLGHLSLVSTTAGASPKELTQRLTDSLDSAFSVDRLSDQDKEGIRSLWQAISADIGLAP